MDAWFWCSGVVGCTTQTFIDNPACTCAVPYPGQSLATACFVGVYAGNLGTPVKCKPQTLFPPGWQSPANQL